MEKWFILYWTTKFQRDIYKVMMLGIVLSQIGLAGGSFWYKFLFEKSYAICSTNTNFACFSMQPNITTPRLDCSNTSYLQENNITSVICYRYAYDLNTATGAALTTIVFNAFSLSSSL